MDIAFYTHRLGAHCVREKNYFASEKAAIAGDGMNIELKRDRAIKCRIDYAINTAK